MSYPQISQITADLKAGDWIDFPPTKSHRGFWHGKVVETRGAFVKVKPLQRNRPSQWWRLCDVRRGWNGRLGPSQNLRQSAKSADTLSAPSADQLP